MGELLEAIPCSRMSANKNRPSQSLSEIVREQIQLVKTEREIKALLDKINDQINQLLVSSNQMQTLLRLHQFQRMVFAYVIFRLKSCN